MALVTSGLVVQLRCDEGTGTTVADSSGNGHNFSFQNSPSWVTEGVRFSTSGLQQITNSGALVSSDLPLATFTYTILAKFTSGAGPCGVNPFGSWPHFAYNSSGWLMTANNELTGGFMDLQPHSLPTDWQVLTYSYQAGAQKLYLNDAVANTKSLTHTYSRGAEFKVGITNVFDLPGWDLGYLLIYDRVLSDAEVEQNYQAIGNEVAARGVALPGIGGLEPTGIASTAAFGTTKVTGPITATGIASTAAFGTAGVALTDFFAEPSGIASTAAFGTSVVAGPITGTGIASTAAFGTSALTVATTNQTLTLTGIASGALFGTTYIVGPDQYIVL